MITFHLVYYQTRREFHPQPKPLGHKNDSQQRHRAFSFGILIEPLQDINADVFVISGESGVMAHQAGFR